MIILVIFSEYCSFHHNNGKAYRPFLEVHMSVQTHPLTSDHYTLYELIILVLLIGQNSKCPWATSLINNMEGREQAAQRLVDFFEATEAGTWVREKGFRALMDNFCGVADRPTIDATQPDVLHLSVHGKTLSCHLRLHQISWQGICPVIETTIQEFDQHYGRSHIPDSPTVH